MSEAKAIVINRIRIFFTLAHVQRKVEYSVFQVYDALFAFAVNLRLRVISEIHLGVNLLLPGRIVIVHHHKSGVSATILHIADDDVLVRFKTFKSA